MSHKKAHRKELSTYHIFIPLSGGNPVVAKLSELLDDRDLEVRTKVAEGLCKLMMSKVITSSKLFTRLILVSAIE